MISVKLVYELQELDLEIDRRRGRLDQIREHLGNDQPLAQPRQAVQEGRQQLKGLQSQHREAELESARLLEKVQNLDRKLYGGTVRNPRELSSMQEELGYLRQHQKEAEEGLLNTMLALDECQSSLTAAEQNLQQVEAEWQREQGELQQERDTLEAEIQRLKETRQSLAARIDTRELEVYERVRKTHAGRAVARVERGRCLGCGITLPTKELQQVRSASQPVRCSSCGRILLAG